MWAEGSLHDAGDILKTVVHKEDLWLVRSVRAVGGEVVFRSTIPRLGRGRERVMPAGQIPVTLIGWRGEGCEWTSE